MAVPPIENLMEPLFAPAEVAARYGYSVGGLSNARLRGVGPRCIRLGNGQIRYPLSALREWEGWPLPSDAAPVAA